MSNSKSSSSSGPIPADLATFKNKIFKIVKSLSSKVLNTSISGMYTDEKDQIKEYTNVHLRDKNTPIPTGFITQIKITHHSNNRDVNKFNDIPRQFGMDIITEDFSPEHNSIKITTITIPKPSTAQYMEITKHPQYIRHVIQQLVNSNKISGDVAKSLKRYL